MGCAFCRPEPLRERPAPVLHKLSLLLGLPDPCNVPRPTPHRAADTTARVMLVAVTLAWGLSWPALKIALNDIPPFSMRVGTSGLATFTLFALALLQRRNMRIHSSVAAVHLVVAGCLNIACFTLFSAFAQLATATSRVAVLAYTMPIWAALFAYPILGERLNVICAISLLLCAAGLTVLIKSEMAHITFSRSPRM